MDKNADLNATNRFDRSLFSLSEMFHENTKLRRMADGWLLTNVEHQPRRSELRHGITHTSKIYRSKLRLLLPRNLPVLATSIEEACRRRRSIRAFSGQDISLNSLSHLLGLSYGITGETCWDDGITTVKQRAAPSAGGLCSNEVYIVALRVTELDHGLYHYQPSDHSLECLQSGNLRASIERSILYPELIPDASIVVLLGAVFHRLKIKYGDRGYRFALMDSGHIAQNMYLVSSALGLGAVAVGGFLDDELNQMLEMNGVDEAVTYVIVIGQPAVQVSMD